MQFPRFQTPSVFLKEYFRNNPEQLQTYVNVAIKATKLAVVPLGAVLKHLIEIQGLDPKTEPGRRMREAFQQAFSHTHVREYDRDFDFSWLNKKFEEARKYNESVDLTKEEFRTLTDVSDLKTEPPPVPPVMRTITDAGVPVTIDRSPVEELADLLDVHPVNQIAPEPAEQVRGGFTMDESWLKSYGDIHANPPRLELPNTRKEYISGDVYKTKVRDILEPLINPPKVPSDLKDALKKLIEIAKSFEDENALEPTKLMARTEELSKLNKLIKEQQPTRSLKKTGKIRRTPTGKMNAVKEAPRKSPKTTKKVLNKRVDNNLSKVEKEVEVIQALIEEGRLTPTDIDNLAFEGLDLRAVNAWKQKYGSVK